MAFKIIHNNWHASNKCVRVSHVSVQKSKVKSPYRLGHRIRKMTITKRWIIEIIAIIIMALGHICQMFKYAVSTEIRAFNCSISSVFLFYGLGHWASDSMLRRKPGIWSDRTHSLFFPLVLNLCLGEPPSLSWDKEAVRAGVSASSYSWRRAACRRLFISGLSMSTADPIQEPKEPLLLCLWLEKIMEVGDWKGPLCGFPLLSLFQVCGYYIQWVKSSGPNPDTCDCGLIWK